MNSFYPNPFSAYPTRQEIIRVNGENGARALQMAPNSSAILLDENAPLVWVVVTDGAGYKTVNPYTITPYQPEPPVDVKGLENRLKRLEELLNGQPDTGNASKGISGNSATQSK